MPEWVVCFIFAMGLMFFCAAVGLPIGFTMFASGLFGLIIFRNHQVAFAALETILQGGPASLELLAIPIFIFMASVLLKTGISQRGYDALARLFGGFKAGLPLATNALLVMFAALTGSSAASIGLVTDMATPELMARGYQRTFISGIITGSGGLAVIIPPSTLFILYGYVMEQPIIDLFAGGLIPGLIMGLAYMVWIWIYVQWKPPVIGSKASQPASGMGSAAESQGIVFSEDALAALGGRLPLTKKLKAGIELLPYLILAFVVLGSMFFGFASITEGAAVGAFGALVLAICYRCLNWRVIRESLWHAASLTGFIMIIVLGGKSLGAFFALTGVASAFAELMTSSGMHGTSLLLLVMLFIFFLGCVMEPMSIIIVIIPLVAKPLLDAGVDPIALAVLMVINCEMALTTPPIGNNLFILAGLGRRHGLSFYDVVIGDIPFGAIEALLLISIIIWPPIASYLPNLLR